MATEIQLLCIKLADVSRELSFELATKLGSNPIGLVMVEPQQPVVKVKNPKRVLAGQISAAKRAIRKAEEEAREAKIAELARMAEEILEEESESDSDEPEPDSESDYESAESDTDE